MGVYFYLFLFLFISMGPTTSDEHTELHVSTEPESSTHNMLHTVRVITVCRFEARQRSTIECSHSGGIKAL